MELQQVERFSAVFQVSLHCLDVQGNGRNKMSTSAVKPAYDPDGDVTTDCDRQVQVQPQPAAEQVKRLLEFHSQMRKTSSYLAIITTETFGRAQVFKPSIGLTVKHGGGCIIMCATEQSG